MFKEILYYVSFNTFDLIWRPERLKFSFWIYLDISLYCLRCHLRE